MFKQLERQFTAVLSAVGALMLTVLFVGAAVVPAETAVNPAATAGSIHA